MAVKDLDGRYRLINGPAPHLGWGADEIIGKLDLDLVDADLGAGAFAIAMRHLMTGGVLLSEDDAPGAPHGVRSSTTVFKNAEGEPAGLINISRVISERQAREERFDSASSWRASPKRTTSPARFSLRYWHVCDVPGWGVGEVWMPTPDGRALERSDIRHSARADLLSRDVAHVTPLTPGEGLAGRAWTSKRAVWVPNVEDDQTFARAVHATALGLKAGVAIPVLAADEAVAVLVFYMYEVREQDERLVHLISVVSAHARALRRKRAEEMRCAHSEENARRLIENLNDVILVLNGTVSHYVSPSVERTLGSLDRRRWGGDRSRFIMQTMPLEPRR